MEIVRALPEENQRAILSYAQFLRAQEYARRGVDHDAEWDRLFNDPVKMANFAKWADGLFATQTPEPFDESKL